MEKKLIITKLNDGYVEPVIKDEDYISEGERSISVKLGGVDPIIQVDGNWSDYLPDNETQVKNFETAGCVVFNSNNQVEILSKKVFGNKPNYSERATYILANVSPPGSDPQIIYEIIRTKGLINEEDLPWSDDIKTLEEYKQPNPLPQDLLDKANGWLISRIFRHEYLPRNFNGWINNEVIKDKLRYSPICVAVHAWAWSDEKQVYVRAGEDTHWTCLYGLNKDGDFLCYDSYPPYKKTLSKDFGFKFAKRIWLSQNLNPQQISIFQKILDFMTRILNLMTQKNQLKPLEPIVVKPKPEPPQPKPPIKVSKLNDWAKAIEQYENAPKKWNNPGAIKGVNGMFLIFNSYQDGFDYLCDYLERAATGKHLAYPKAGKTTMLEFQKIYSPSINGNNPERYCSWVCNRIGVSPEDKIGDVV